MSSGHVVGSYVTAAFVVAAAVGLWLSNRRREAKRWWQR